MAEISKTYEPNSISDRLYAKWLDKDLYHADPQSTKPAFSIVIPPPNVTGILTLGHVLNTTIQDILCRRARMQGFEVLWLPGTDHAGLATQTKVEKNLADQNLTKEQLGRSAFLEKVWEWKEKHGGIITSQLKKIGCSCDWKRERFTMDEDYYRAVATAFVKLYDQGHIYRGHRMVNWCPATRTAISDEEVIATPQTGKLYTMKYQVVEEPGTYLEIATTRPETIMGDTAVAVHPRDPRYVHLIGKHCRRPFPAAYIPIIGDEHIDMEFGTGVLKVTPAHDKADFEIGQRHGLPHIDVLNPDGTIHCPEMPALDGLDRFKARDQAASLLDEMGLLVKTEKYKNNVGFSERGGVPIEPRLSEQWFLKYPRTSETYSAVLDGSIRFHPQRWVKVYQHWLENLQDWCISRQIWWGHRIPVWYRGGETRCQIESPGPEWQQDPDALDTWFSSWLWAYETMNAPTREKFYPTDVLVTGPDIIFLWVARMIFAGLTFEPSGTSEMKKNIPFRDVYFTGLIRDHRGRKLSKSLGNSPDPLELIEQFGADGLRFGLMRVAPQGLDIRYDNKQIEEGRNFCTKLWNACRFRSLQGEVDPMADPTAHHLSPYCHLILRQLGELIDRVDEYYEAYQFNQVASALYGFVWNQLCSRFLEAAKADFMDPTSASREGTLATFDYVISRVLRLLHPFTPFITEELWLQMGYGKDTIQFETWPAHPGKIWDEPEADHAGNIFSALDESRKLRGEFGIALNQQVCFKLAPKGELSSNTRTMLESLMNARPLEITSTPPARTPMTLTPLGELYLPLEGLVDLEKEIARLEKAVAKAAADCERERKKLSNEAMVQNAPAEKVEEWRAVLAESEAALLKWSEQLRLLK
ncbi:MAG: valine--tRNA ligase [Candidatus Methylacidiphilales bacterium]